MHVYKNNASIAVTTFCNSETLPCMLADVEREMEDTQRTNKVMNFLNGEVLDSNL